MLHGGWWSLAAAIALGASGAGSAVPAFAIAACAAISLARMVASSSWWLVSRSSASDFF